MMITVIKKSLILTAFICLVTLGSVFSNANIGTENWSYKIGDSPIDSNGNFEWLKEDSNGWQEFLRASQSFAYGWGSRAPACLFPPKSCPYRTPSSTL